MVRYRKDIDYWRTKQELEQKKTCHVCDWLVKGIEGYSSSSSVGEC